jgi:hypothetical protein
MALNLTASNSFKGELEARKVLKYKSYLTDNTLYFLRKPSRRAYRDINVVYFKSHPEHTDTICEQNEEFIMSSLTVQTRNIRLCSVNDDIRTIDLVCPSAV